MTTKSDRELLIAAANAAGIRHHGTTGDAGLWIAADSPHWWNPLTDDGDALRLAVKLKLNIMQGDFSVGVNDESGIDEADLVRNEGERLAVLRRAIVRAAAEMAK